MGKARRLHQLSLPNIYEPLEFQLFATNKKTKPPLNRQLGFLIKLRNPGPLGQSKIPPPGIRDNRLCL
jgi:hypothetical protein